MGLDLKKEIKLSDLFARGKKRQNGATRPEASNGNADRPAPQAPLMRAFNLLPQEQPRERARRRPSVGQFAVSVGGVLLFGALGALFLVTSAQLHEKRARHEELRDRVAVLDAPASGAEGQPDGKLVEERRARTQAVAGALGTRVAWDRVLRELSLVLPDDVSLTALTGASPAGGQAAAAASGASAAPGSGQVTMTGYALNQASVARLLARLAVVPELADVKLQSSERAGGGENVQFSIVASLKQGGPAA